GAHAVLVEAQGGNRGDAGRSHRLRVLVRVELDDLDSAVVLGCELVQQRCDLLARAAPGGPDVYDDGEVGIEDFSLEGGVGDRCGGAHANTSSVSSSIVVLSSRADR